MLRTVAPPPPIRDTGDYGGYHLSRSTSCGPVESGPPDNYEVSTSQKMVLFKYGNCKGQRTNCKKNAMLKTELSNQIQTSN
jgi:hypothetical protein